MNDEPRSEDVERIVDELIAELGVRVDTPAATPPRTTDRVERTRGSWMDQIGRARRAG